MLQVRCIFTRARGNRYIEAVWQFCLTFSLIIYTFGFAYQSVLDQESVIQLLQHRVVSALVDAAPSAAFLHQTC